MQSEIKIRVFIFQWQNSKLGSGLPSHLQIIGPTSPNMMHVYMHSRVDLDTMRSFLACDSGTWAIDDDWS